jgi:phage-related protein
MSDFTYVPSYTTDGADKFAELVNKFGDGYQQVIPDGINPVAETWNLVFDPIPIADIGSIRAFFREKTGQTFTWTNPSGVEKRYRRTGDVTWAIAGNAGSLHVTIEEAFGA